VQQEKSNNNNNNNVTAGRTDRQMDRIASVSH